MRKLKVVIDEVRRLSQEEGLRDQEVAKFMGISRASVVRIRKENDIPYANSKNRLDKKYVCSGCSKTITIRRHQRRQNYCPSCKSKVKKNEPLPVTMGIHK